MNQIRARIIGVMRLDILTIRIGFIVILAMLAWMLNPFANVDSINSWDLNLEAKRLLSAGIGAIAALFIIAFEMRVRRASLKTLIGAAIGSTLGIVGAYLIGMLISSQETAAVPAEMKTFLTVTLAFLMAYLGLMVGAAKGEYIDLSVLGGVFSDKDIKRDYKILDTSVIIDGRIADVAETGFLGGTIIIPQFILTELQQVADSPDSSKRQRGRRGLDM